MTKVKHTPWTVTDNSWEVSSVYDAQGNCVAECRISDEADEDTQDEFEAEKEARARLIAAAPDLLEAIKKLLRTAEEELHDVDHALGVYEARAAVEKAEGR